MTIRHILTPVTGEADAGHIFVTAFKLAQRLSAHVTATDTAADPGPYFDPTGAALPAVYYDEIRATLDRVQKHKRERAVGFFEDALKATGVAVSESAGKGATATWYDSTTVDGATVSSLGRLADLIVINQPGEHGGVAELEIVEDAVFTVRRPVLVMPKGTSDIGTSAAIAWNGSLEAADAVERALDVLVPGAPITVIQIGDVKSGGTPAEGLIAYLSWHGFPATLKRREEEPKTTPQAILAEAKAAGAGLLIMGAYTHSRLREMVLGGVTDFMLRHADLPLLLAH